MKKSMIFLFVLSVFSVNTMAFGKAAIWCTGERGQLVNAINPYNGYECVGPLLSATDACFTGIRSEAIDLLNSDDISNIFDGTDGEYISDALPKGKDSITYTTHDDANDMVFTGSVLKRCTQEWFDSFK